ncbi:MAG: PH domain-containing protein [Saccharofermentanales bacterium]|jgi:putative membrane protein
MEPVRCHFTVILERLFKVYWQLLIAMAIPLFSSGLGQVRGIAILLFAVSFVILAGLQVLYWLNTRLYADDEQVYVRFGFFWKRQLTIPFSKINTVDLSRNLFQRIVGTCRLKIDTGAVSGKAKGGAETDLVFKLADAERIRAHILSLRGGVASLHNEFVDLPAGMTEPESMPDIEVSGARYRRDDSVTGSETVLFRAQTRDFFLYGLTQNKVLTGFLLILSLAATAGEFLGEGFYEQVYELFSQAGAFLSRFELLALIIAVLVIFIIYYLLANIISVLTAVVRFFNFRVSRAGDAIHIEYGLVSVRSYTMPLRNIHAVVVKQNLLRQWLKQCSVELVSIGYGDDNHEVALLFPLIPVTRLEAALREVLPEYEGTLTRTKAPARARRLYLFLPVALLLVLTALPAILLQPLIWLSLLVTLPFLIWTRLLNHRHASIGYSPERLEVTTGGFNYKEYRIRMAAVQSVSTHSNWFSEQIDLKSYKVDYHAPKLRASANVSFLAAEHLEELREIPSLLN